MGCHPPSAGPQRRVTLTWFSVRVILRIIMPIAGPGTVATLLFGFLLAWQDLLWALCLISPTIILYLFPQRFYVEGLARGAVKDWCIACPRNPKTHGRFRP